MARGMSTAKKQTTTTAKSAETTAKKAEKKYKATDLIACKSITNGELLHVGKKSGSLYRWANYDDVEYVEYQDLVYEVRSAGKKSVVYEPLFVVIDDDFLKEFTELDELYNETYPLSQLADVLTLPANELEKVVTKLPLGAKNSLKGIAATMVEEGTIDSLKSIKILDDVLGTNLKLLLSE